jgi:hypothetical protein
MFLSISLESGTSWKYARGEEIFDYQTSSQDRSPDFRSVKSTNSGACPKCGGMGGNLSILL